MSDTPPLSMPPTPPKPKPWGRGVLVVSLAINFLIVGLVAGAFLSGGRDRDRNPHFRDIGFGPFVQALSKSDKQELGEAMKRESGPLRENRDTIRRQFATLLEGLRAEPFDAALFGRLITDQRSKISERQMLGQTLLLERINAMSLEERSAYADSIEKALRRGARRPKP